MKLSKFILLFIAAALFVGCQPAVQGDSVQPRGGYQGKERTGTDSTMTLMYCWGEGPTIAVARQQALLWGVKGVIQTYCKNKNNVYNHSAFNEQVSLFANLKQETGKQNMIPGGYRWEGDCSIEKPKMLEWLEEINEKITGTGGMEGGMQPKIAIMPTRVYGAIEDLDLTAHEASILNSLKEQLKDNGYDVHDYETLIKGFSSIKAQGIGDLQLDTNFQIEADIYIKFDIRVMDDGETVKARCLTDAVMVSTALSIGTTDGWSKAYAKSTPGAEEIALKEVSNDAMNKLLTMITKTWQKEIKKGFYWKLFLKGVEDDKQEVVLTALEEVAQGIPGFDKQQGDYMEFSTYAPLDLYNAIKFKSAFKAALEKHDLTIEEAPLQNRHALVYVIGAK